VRFALFLLLNKEGRFFVVVFYLIFIPFSTMRKSITLILTSAFVIFFFSSSTQFSSAPPSGYSGVNGYTCANCHAGSPVNIGGGAVTITGLPTGSYTPGRAYPISITISHGTSNRSRWGFSLAARNGVGQAAGTFITTNPNTTLIGAAEIGHNAAVVTPLSSSYTYSGIQWVAPSTPSTNDLNIKFYSVGLAANGNGGSGGDNVYSNLINTTFTTLPVILTSFDAKAGKNNSVELSWETALEQNSKVFVIERSTDGRFFQPIEQIDAAGNSAFPRRYFFTDLNPSSTGNTTRIYRLKQIDNDQNYTYSKLVSIKLNPPKIFIGKLIPNVIKRDESTSLTIFAPTPSLYQIMLTDALGRKLYSTHYKANSGFNSIPIKTASYHLGTGTYYLNIQAGENSQTERLVVQ
jgi:hypothetical protein